jgi:hypothetical protein
LIDKYHKKMKSVPPKDNFSPIFIAALFSIMLN